MKFFLSFAGLTLLLYHGVNLFSPERLRAGFSTQLLSLRTGDTVHWEIPSWLLVRSHQSTLDAASTRLARISEGLMGSQQIALPLTQSPRPVTPGSEVNEGNITFLRGFLQAAKLAGAEVLLLPIPSHDLMLGNPSWEGVHRRLLEVDSKRVIDLLGPYRNLRNQALYDDEDNHWSHLGIAVAAKEVVSALKKLGWELGEPTIELARTPQFGSFGPTLYRPAPSISFLWPMEKRPRRLILFGTSFTRKYSEHGADFASVLGNLLELEPANYAFASARLRGSLERSRKEGFDLRSGDLIIWEFPVSDFIQHGN